MTEGNSASTAEDPARVEPDAMSICVLGSINVDWVHRVARLPTPGETVMAGVGARLPGGKGANQAIAAARLGGRVQMIGAVGDDEDGAAMIDALRSADVDTSGVAVRANSTTGRAFIAVDPAGENMIFVSAGANAEARFEGGGAACSVFVAQMEVPAPEIESFFRSEAAATGLKILNAAPAVPEASELMSLADIIVVNETELAFYVGPTTVETGLEASAGGLRSRADQTVVVTLGAKGAAVIGPQGSSVIEGRALEAIDATGAGDCFCGALAAAMWRGSSIVDAVDFANRAAALSTLTSGAASSMPTLSELDAAYRLKASSDTEDQ